MARPKKVIDEEQLVKCAQKMWTTAEIAAFFRVSTDTIHRRYAAIVEEARQSGKAKLRDLQWKRALEGSDTMIKHMSEHYLDQHARQRIDLDKVPEEQIQEYLKKKLENE